MKRILLGILMIAAVSTAVAATGAWLVDNEASAGSVATSALVNLRVDGTDLNVAKFTLPQIVPGNQPVRYWTLKNEGNIPGYLDLHGIKVTETEGTYTEPEVEAGDTTPDVGELGEILDIQLYVDGNKNGSWDGAPTDTKIFGGDFCDIASDYDMSLMIPAGGEVRIMAVIDWWSEHDPVVHDSQAMTDGLTFDIGFQLGQTAGQ